MARAKAGLAFMAEAICELVARPGMGAPEPGTCPPTNVRCPFEDPGNDWLEVTGMVLVARAGLEIGATARPPSNPRKKVRPPRSKVMPAPEISMIL
jgi:hypothetical protein